MEVGDGGDRRRPPEGREVLPVGVDNQLKEREMKSPFQLEILKEAYAVDPRPSAEVRAELAERTGLPVEKVSMWFATTRFRDRQCPPANQPRRQGRPPLPPQSQGSGTSMEAASRSREGSDFLAGGIDRRPSPASVSRVRPETVMPIRFYEPERPIQPFNWPLLPLQPPMPPQAQLKLGQLPLPQLSMPQLPPLPQLTMPQPPPQHLTMPQLPPPPQLMMPQLPPRHLTMPQLPPPQHLTMPQLPPLQHLTMPQLLPPPQLTMPQPPLQHLTLAQRPLPQQTMPQPPLSQLPMPQPPVLQPPQHSVLRPTIQKAPVYNVEFDPLPSGAFGTPRAMTSDGKMFEGHDAKSIKASTFLPNMGNNFMPSSSTERSPVDGGIYVFHPQTSQRTLEEYQFLPEKPSLQSETCQMVKKSHFFDSSVGTLYTKVSSVPLGGQFRYGNEQVTSTYTFQRQMSSSILQSQEGEQQVLKSDSTDNSTPHNNSTDTAKVAQYGINPVGPENQIRSSDRRISFDDHASRMERIRKGKFIMCEGGRIEKEVGNHEKLIMEELERQDSLKKMEEQMGNELVTYNCEKEKEAEGQIPEKQPEEGKSQVEQHRENELREKFLLKENLGAEKIWQKELQEAAGLKAVDGSVINQQFAKEYADFSEDEYTYLIEDERLELMKLAASSKGLSSLRFLDNDTLQQLDLFKDMLSTFPPTSVPLKRPFSVQPWTDSEEIIGNLLMVWKFLVTFADVLGLWPFTLDELVQSLHDYDSRLLGEVHVALLKCIIKDIDHVACTTAASGANQISVANPEGVQLHIVEGAYTWGFDIPSWQRHLNFLTWPEILRQVALSIGFGPCLKKINLDNVYSSDDDERINVGDVISSLRSGAAAENAVALMQEKGLSHLSRSRHWITPGTLKFAAFHVLSLEGDGGLRLVEIVDKIQKYGLRDLTTNKAPEASIAAALLRDAKLFERVAPSTYCVRPPFRKDPADADVILTAARERIQLFKSGLSESKKAERNSEDADNAEDSECNCADDAEADTCTKAKLNANLTCSEKLKYAKASTFSANEKGKGLQGAHHNASNCNDASNADYEDAKIDTANFGEPWVQGLMEGEYSELSVEERLNALVALIGVAIEGKSLRYVLQERHEAANALKKQMWAEARLEKRRLKEEYMSKLHHSSLVGSKTEAVLTNVATEGGQRPLQNIDCRSSDGNPNSVNNAQLSVQANQDDVNNMSTERNLLRHDFFSYSGSVSLERHGCTVEMSTSELKEYIVHKAEEIYAYRFLPLGEDRRHNRYWQFSMCASPNDPGSGRIFFESKDGFWRLIDSEEAFNALLDVLDTHGFRESHLHSMLKKIEETFKETIRRKKICIDSVDSTDHLIGTDTTEMTASPNCNPATDSLSSTPCGYTSDTLEHSASFRIELGRNKLERRLALKRYQGYVRWMWSACFNSYVLCAMKYGTKRCSELLATCAFCYQSYFAEERHCPSCHVTFKASHNAYANFPEHLAQCEEKRITESERKNQDSDSSVPISIRLLKALLALIEVSIPAEALQMFWTEDYRKSWGAKLRSSLSAEDLLQILTLLERAIKQDLLPPEFVSTSELLRSTRGFEVHDIASGAVPLLPWVPNTTAAVSFRLLVLDASIPYQLHQNVCYREEKEVDEFMILPRCTQYLDTTETPEPVDYQNERERFGASARGSRGRGGRGRGRRGRSYRGSRSSIDEETRGNSENPDRNKRRRGRPHGGGRGWGLHLSGTQKESQNTVSAEVRAVGVSAMVVDEESPSISDGTEWDVEDTRMEHVEDASGSVGSGSREKE